MFEQSAAALQFGGEPEAPPSDVTSRAKRRNLEDERAAKRERILDAAVSVFGYSGFAKASVEEIAKRATVGKSAVYQVAESKEELYMLTVEREVRRWHEATSALLDQSEPAEQLLFQVAAQAMETVYGNPLLRDLFCGETANLLAKAEARLRDLRQVGADNLARVVRIGMAQGAWRADLDAEVVAGVLQDVWMGLWMLEPSHMTSTAQLTRATTAFELILSGLRTRQG